MADSKPILTEQKNRFASKSEAEIALILDGRNAKNTQRATKSNIKTFHDYLAEKSYPELHEINMEELPEILENFYPNLRRIDGEQYKLQSIKCIRAGLNRWTKANRSVDIIKDVKYTKANEIFKGISKLARKDGRATTRSTPVIAHEDLERIATYFLHDILNKPEPKKLQQCVLFYIIYFFCRRGRENLYQMNLQTFETACDPDGTQYIFQSLDELDKNHQADCTEPANQGRIYERPGNLKNS